MRRLWGYPDKDRPVALSEVQENSRMSEYDAVTDDQWATIRAEYLKQTRDSLEKFGYHPSRIKTLMFQAECNIADHIAEMQAEIPNWLTPRRQRILSVIR